jgi:hypothetical protein
MFSFFRPGCPDLFQWIGILQKNNVKTLAQLISLTSTDLENVIEFCYPTLDPLAGPLFYMVRLRISDGNFYNVFCLLDQTPYRFPGVVPTEQSCICILSRYCHPQVFADCLRGLRSLLMRSAASAQKFVDCLISAPFSMPAIPSLTPVLSGQYTNAQHSKRLSELTATTFPTDLLARLLLAILTDTSIILASSHLSRLTDFSLGLLSLLFPFRWEHMFAPILPASLVSTLQNPAPFIVGVHKSLLPELDLDLIEDHLLVDLDGAVIIRRWIDSVPDWAHDLGTQIPNGSTDGLRMFVTRVLCNALGVEPSSFARATAKRIKRVLMEHRSLKGFAADLFNSRTVQAFRDILVEGSLPPEFLQFLGFQGERHTVTSLAIQHLEDFPERKSRRSGSSDSDSTGSS